MTPKSEKTLLQAELRRVWGMVDILLAVVIKSRFDYVFTCASIMSPLAVLPLLVASSKDCSLVTITLARHIVAKSFIIFQHVLVNKSLYLRYYFFLMFICLVLLMISDIFIHAPEIPPKRI